MSNLANVGWEGGGGGGAWNNFCKSAGTSELRQTQIPVWKHGGLLPGCKITVPSLRSGRYGVR